MPVFAKFLAKHMIFLRTFTTQNATILALSRSFRHEKRAPVMISSKYSAEHHHALSAGRKTSQASSVKARHPGGMRSKSFALLLKSHIPSAA
jgi:hypothetical protein